MSSAGHSPGSDTGSHLRDLQGHVWCSDPTTLHFIGSRDSGTESLYSLESLAPYSSSRHHFLQSSHSGSNENIILQYLATQCSAFSCCCVWSKESLDTAAHKYICSWSLYFISHPWPLP